MENEEKETLTDVEENIPHPMADYPVADAKIETSAEKYEDFARRNGDSHLPVLPPDGEEEMGNNLNDSKKKKRIPEVLLDKKKIIPVFALIAIILVGFFYLKGKDSDNQVQTPDNTIIDSTMKSMEDVQSYSFDGTMRFKRTFTSGESEYGMEYQVIYKGVVEEDNQGSPAAYSSIVYDTTRSAGEKKKTTGANMDSVIISGKKYLKLNSLSLGVTSPTSKAASLESGLKGYSGSWYTLAEGNYESFYAEIKDYAFLPADLDMLDVENLGDWSEILDHKLLVSAQDLGSEPVREVETTHYSAKLNNAGAIELISALAEKGANAEDSGDTKSSLQALQADSEEAEKFMQVIDYIMKNVSIELWIGKDDNLIHRFRISGTFDSDAIAGFYSRLETIYGESYTEEEGSVEDKGIDFEIDYTLSGFNSSKVREPEGAKDFTEVMQTLRSINPELMVITDAASVDSDADGLSDEQEKFYGSDANKADTDGDGYSDGSEVKGGYDPVVAGSARLDHSELQKAQ